MVNKCHKQEQQYMLLVLRLHKSVHLQYIANRKVHECVPAQASLEMQCWVYGESKTALPVLDSPALPLASHQYAFLYYAS